MPPADTRSVRGGPSVLSRRLLAVLAVLVVAGTLVLTTGDGAARASGSGALMPVAGTCSVDRACRVAIEWRTSASGPSGAGDSPLRRRTLFSVFARAGEQIL